jgi:hypothetical protein
MAVVSLISGIASWLGIPLLGAIAAIITGHMARSQIRQSHGLEEGDGLAVAGLVLGYLNLILSCVLPILIFAGVISVGGLCSVCSILAESGGFEVSSAAVMPPIPLY